MARLLNFKIKKRRKRTRQWWALTKFNFKHKIKEPLALTRFADALQIERGKKEENSGWDRKIWRITVLRQDRKRKKN